MLMLLTLLPIAPAVAARTQIQSQRSRSPGESATASNLITGGHVCFVSSVAGVDVQIGSLSISLLTGKIMFRSVLYTTADYSLYVSDGYAIVKWWKLFTPKKLRTKLGGCVVA